MKKLAISLVAVIMLIGGGSAIARNVSYKCETLYPKGNGTIVNGTFVPLDPGQILKICTRR